MLKHYNVTLGSLKYGMLHEDGLIKTETCWSLQFISCESLILINYFLIYFYCSPSKSNCTCTLHLEVFFFPFAITCTEKNMRIRNWPIRVYLHKLAHTLTQTFRKDHQHEFVSFSIAWQHAVFYISKWRDRRIVPILDVLPELIIFHARLSKRSVVEYLPCKY